jgi:hypothetical protein
MDAFLETGRFPTDVGWGEAAGAMKKAFAQWNDLADIIGEEDLVRLLDTVLPVGDRKAAAVMTSSTELASTRMPASVMFGPKIGGAFYRNLGGFFGEVTMDRWFRRTIGRVTGDLLHKPSKATLEKAGEALKRALVAEHGHSGKNLGPARLERHARRLVKEWDATVRNRPKHNGKADYRNKPESVKKAQSSLKNRAPGGRDAPSSAGERKRLRDIVERLQGEVEKRTRKRWDVASLQAI